MVTAGAVTCGTPREETKGGRAGESWGGRGRARVGVLAEREARGKDKSGRHRGGILQAQGRERKAKGGKGGESRADEEG